MSICMTFHDRVTFPNFSCHLSHFHDYFRFSKSTSSTKPNDREQMCLLSSSLQWLAIVSFLCHLWPFSRLVQIMAKTTSIANAGESMVSRALLDCLNIQFFARLAAISTSGSGFYCAMLCIRGTSHGPVSVCPSVRLSQVGVLLKRLNVGSHKQHHTIVQGL